MWILLKKNSSKKKTWNKNMFNFQKVLLRIITFISAVKMNEKEAIERIHNIYSGKAQIQNTTQILF